MLVFLIFGVSLTGAFSLGSVGNTVIYNETELVSCENVLNNSWCGKDVDVFKNECQDLGFVSEQLNPWETCNDDGSKFCGACGEPVYDYRAECASRGDNWWSGDNLNSLRSDCPNGEFEYYQMNNGDYCGGCFEIDNDLNDS